MPSSWINLWNTVKLNLLVFGGLLLLIELLFGHWFRPLLQIECQHIYYHHDYCPSIVNKHKMIDEDGGAVIENVVNASGIRVADRSLIDSTTDTAQYDVINIGDSFMQAQAIPYEGTLSHIQESLTGKKVLQVGMSSWAPAIYKNWLRKHPLKEGVEINVFLMINDVAAHDPFSNLAYYHKSVENEIDILVFPVSKKMAIKQFLMLRSFFYSNISKIRQGWINRPRSKQDAIAGAPIYDWLDVKYFKPQIDCAPLEKYKNNTQPLAYDYLEFAFKYDCWSTQALETVNNTVRDLRAIKNVIDSVHGKMRVFVVPAGWAFPNETMAGKSASYYQMSPDTVLTTSPLISYLQKRLTVPVISLERVIGNMKRQEKTPEKWFFDFDGHWTEHAHRRLGEWISRLERHNTYENIN